MYNLCNGFIDEATMLSLGLTLLVILGWILWSYVVISRSAKIKSVVAGIDLLFLVAALGSFLYSVSGEAGSDLIKGTGLACGTIFVLPLAGFGKLTGGALSPSLAAIPYALLIVISWFLAGMVKKRGIADAYLEKVEMKYQKKLEKKNTGKKEAVVQEEEKEESEVAVSDENPEPAVIEEEPEEEEVLRTRESVQSREPVILAEEGDAMQEEEEILTTPSPFEEVIIEEEPEVLIKEEPAACEDELHLITGEREIPEKEEEEEAPMRTFFRRRPRSGKKNFDDEIKIIK